MKKILIQVSMIGFMVVILTACGSQWGTQALISHKKSEVSDTNITSSQSWVIEKLPSTGNNIGSDAMMYAHSARILIENFQMNSGQYPRYPESECVSEILPLIANPDLKQMISWVSNLSTGKCPTGAAYKVLTDNNYTTGFLVVAARVPQLYSNFDGSKWESADINTFISSYKKREAVTSTNPDDWYYVNVNTYE